MESNNKGTFNKGMVVAVVVLITLVCVGLIISINVKKRIEEQNQKRIGDAIVMPKTSASAEEAASSSAEETSEITADDIYRILAKETYELEDGSTMILSLFRDKTDNSLYLDAHVSATDFESIKMLNPVIYTCASSEGKYKKFALTSEIDGTMVLSYVYDFENRSFSLAFGMEKEDVSSEFKLGIPEWLVDSNNEYRENAETPRYTNMRSNVTDCYEHFVENHVDNFN